MFIHQNFPGQFGGISSTLANNPQNEVRGLGQIANFRPEKAKKSPVRFFGYPFNPPAPPKSHLYLDEFQTQIYRGQAVANAAVSLIQKGFRPDVVIAHPGWGEALFLRDCFPDARLVLYGEYYYHGVGGDVGFDPEFPLSADYKLKTRLKNCTQLQSLVACDGVIAPTAWQKSRYPVEFHTKIEVMHEGVDTATVRPNANAVFEFKNRRFISGQPILTYVARNLEPYRGFHIFMRALPTILRQNPHVEVLIVGGDDVSYGLRLPEGSTYREIYTKELGAKIDWERVHFLGKLPYAEYLKVLQVSTAHVYLTYPFVLSWSLLEAMATGCLVIASDTDPVAEVVTNQHNGILTNFFDHDRLANCVLSALAAPQQFQSIRENARQTIIDQFDQTKICLPRWIEYITRDQA